MPIFRMKLPHWFALAAGGSLWVLLIFLLRLIVY